MTAMSELRNVSRLALLLAQYFLYRLGRPKQPEVARYYAEGFAGLDFLFGWSRRMRIVDGEHCPKSGPVVFASNHVCLDDPFATSSAIFQLSQGGIRPHIMMRDDFFRGLPHWLKRIADPDEVTRMLGALQISRKSAEPTQLIPFIELLRQAHAFLIYPGRSRSRSGLFVEYRDWIRAPGGTSFFLAQAQVGCPEARVPAVPVARTYNPVKHGGALVFGAPRYLRPGADRAEQRAFDHDLVVAMSDLVEINVAQVLSAYLFLHCLHGFSDIVDTDMLTERLGRVFLDIPECHIEPAAQSGLEDEIRQALRFLRAYGLLRIESTKIRLYPKAVLSVPSSISEYRRRNPLKYLANQILHISRVVRAIDRQVWR